MPFEIVRNDIAGVTADAIVNTANPRPRIGIGVDSLLHRKAGPQLLADRKRIGPLEPGAAAITPAYGLSARYVIHTVGPLWRGGDRGEADILRRCYDASLALALEHGCGSVAFPLISTGNYGFPKEQALQIAVAAFRAFLSEHEMRITLVVFDRESYRLSESLFRGVAAYIDENYVSAHSSGRKRRFSLRENRNDKESAVCEDTSVWEMAEICNEAPPAAFTAPAPAASKAMSLEEMLKQADAGFTETLLKLIDRSGKKDPEVYKRANLTKQHFSKIRNDPHYRPKKPTAVALAIALELDLEQTQDLLERAGFVLSNSSKFDLIIRYFIREGIYDTMQINLTLFQFDQPLLGM